MKYLILFYSLFLFGCWNRTSSPLNSGVANTSKDTVNLYKFINKYSLPHRTLLPEEVSLDREAFSAWLIGEHPILKKDLVNKDWEMYYHYYSKYFGDSKDTTSFKEFLPQQIAYQEYIQVCGQYLSIADLSQQEENYWIDSLRYGYGFIEGSRKKNIPKNIYFLHSRSITVQEIYIKNKVYLAIFLDPEINSSVSAYHLLLLDVTNTDKIKGILIFTYQINGFREIGDFNNDGALDMIIPMSRKDSVQYIYTIRNDSMVLDTTRYVFLTGCPPYDYAWMCVPDSLVLSKSKWW